MHTAIVNFADFLLLRFTINGENFYPWEGKVLEWKRSLDMKTNRLVRSVVWENSKGERTRFCFERFASYDDDHVFAMKAAVEPLNYSGVIEVMSGIDTLTKSVGGAGGGFLLTTAKKLRVQGGKTFYACDSGEKYAFRIAVGAETRLYQDGACLENSWQDAGEPDMAAVHTSFGVEQGQTYTVEKIVYVATERDWEQARNLLLYRYRMLEGAKRNAKEEGREGARYPFNSAITGEEEVWPVSRHPFMQIHIVSDVAWSVCNYYNCTGDDDFMISYGMEMLYEIGRYWLSRVEKDERGYVIRQVTGTDEHHPYVDNNAYTNYVVHYIVKRTLELTEQFAGKLSAVYEKAQVTEGFLDSLRDLAEHLYLPMDPVTGMIPQFDGYFDLSRDLEVAAGNAGQAQAFQMKTAGMYHRSQVIKQPDVLVLFAYQNMTFSPRIYSRNWDYYRARCEASSSLSYSVHSICASNMEEPESTYT